MFWIGDAPKRPTVSRPSTPFGNETASREYVPGAITIA
jgi:hypothetical protein